MNNNTGNGISGFGEHVEGYAIPVLNEREIRAAAGMLFLMLFISVMVVILKQDFFLLKYAVSIFLVDIVIRVFINPRYAPFLVVGRWVVRNQVPEYVGAQQKKFAWIIGVVLASVFFVHLILLNAYSPITGIVCFVCLIFLFFEAAFGICLGCKMYSMVYREKARYCPGEVCVAGERHDIQRITGSQLAVVAGFIVLIILAAPMLKEYYGQAPYDIFGIDSSGTHR
ncbi:MAG: DUF4395 domain-containing protein [Gammaproteobacteria bacterium]|nr:DUF4395 domain-containing protein [Gammaproteobacteria bacterium]